MAVPKYAQVNVFKEKGGGEPDMGGACLVSLRVM